jgi:hypothetical protein
MIAYLVGCVFVFVFVTVFNAVFRMDRILNTMSDINKHGYIVKHNIIGAGDVKDIQNNWDNKRYRDIFTSLKTNKNIRDFIEYHLSPDFILMDYVMFLSNSVLHTCHRDNNGMKFNDIKHKSYTVLIYIDDMKKCLDVTPGSHKHFGMYKDDKTETFMCKPGSIILFDADLVHSGSLSDNKDNRRIQLKVCHKEDEQKLKFYDNYHKILDKPNVNSAFSKKIQKQLTCAYPLFSDLTQGNNKNYISGKMSETEKIFSKMFYSDKDYYKLEDAF